MIGAQETVQETVGDIQTGFGATGWGGIGGGIASGCCCYWGGRRRAGSHAARQLEFVRVHDCTWYWPTVLPGFWYDAILTILGNPRIYLIVILKNEVCSALSTVMAARAIRIRMHACMYAWPRARCACMAALST